MAKNESWPGKGMPVLWALALGMLATVAAVWAMVAKQDREKAGEDKEDWKSR